jgi:CRP/FNR family transcriptional regulator
MKQPLSNARIRDAIAANEVLSKLRFASKQKLVAGATLHELDRGAVICHQETPATRFWLVLRGQVKLVKYTTKGVALLIDLVLPEQLFGAVFYRHNPVYPCTALAMKPTELLSFRLKDLIDELEHNPPLQKMLLEDTCYRLCHAQRMRGLGLEEARVRVAHLLLYLYEKFGRVIPVTRATLAELAGTSVETAIRISNALARRGVLATRRGEIEIRSLADLQRCTQGAEREL